MATTSAPVRGPGDSGSTASSLLAQLLGPSQRRRLALALLVGGGAAAVAHYSSVNRRSAGSGVSESKSSAVEGESGGEKGGERAKGSRDSSRRRPTNGLKELLPLMLKVAGKRLAVLLALSILRTLMSNRLARLQGRLFESAFLTKVPQFLRTLGENMALCAVCSSIESTLSTVVTQMDLSWRAALTNRLHRRYFDNMMYYKLSHVDRELDSPEQRICEDIPKLCTGMSNLSQEWVVSLVDTVFYSYRLKSYMGTHGYSLAILAYVFGVGGTTAALAPPFGRLFKKQARLEGSYRSLQSRLLANSESIALYGGILKEGGIVQAAFGRLMAQQGRLQRLQWRFGMVQDFFLKYLASTVAVALIIGPFFAGRMKPDDSTAGRALMLSRMRYHTSVIISFFAAVGTLASSSRSLMKLGAHADRVVELERRIKLLTERQGARVGGEGGGGAEYVETEKSIFFEGATIVTPADSTLVRNLSLQVPAGTNLLVTGPNGAGKSSLFRVLGGLWPLTAGRIGKPGGSSAEGLCADIFYVPQRPYVTVGTLQEQLIYPQTLPDDGSDVISVEEQRRLLCKVDLEGLLEREVAGKALDWGSELSLGEQQRLGMARLFYHRPRFAILDECTSGVTVDMEARFCNAVAQLGCTCITISHRPALVAYHDLVLALDGSGGWSVHPGLRAKEASGKSTGSKVHTSVSAADLEEGLNGKQVDWQVLARAEPQAASAPGGFLNVLEIGSEPRLARGVRPLLAALREGSTVAGPVLRHLARHSQPRQVGAIAAVLLLRTALQDRIASLNGRSVDYVLQQDANAFKKLIGISVIQSMGSAVIAPSLRYLTDRLALDWRKSLTAAITSQYLKGHNFYAVQHLTGIRDVDQRITRDVQRLVDDLAGLVPSLVKPAVDLLWFSRQMLSLTGLRGLAILYLYMLLSASSLRLLTPDFAALAEEEAAREGALRTVHARLRAHAESVAFFGGGQREGRLISAKFAALQNHLRYMARAKWAYGAADDFFSRQLPHNATWGLTLLYALQHKVRGAHPRTQGALVHDMRYLASVVSNCFSAFGELLALRKRFAQLGGGMARVAGLMEALEAVQKRHLPPPQQVRRLKAPVVAADSSVGEQARPEEGCLTFDDVDVVTPSGALLARRLSVFIRPGDNLLITGPNGCGKSSLLRLLAGLWPLRNGVVTCQGKDGPETPSTAIAPAPGRRPIMFFVPQKPYTSLGSFREQFIYPLSVDEAIARERAESSDPMSADSALRALDAKLERLVRIIKLEHLLERQGGFAAVTEWEERLSLGEQQRLGMARMFYHRPHMALLDECTNAMSTDVEAELYRHAIEGGVTLVTISQRTALLEFHPRELRLLDGRGAWELRLHRPAIALHPPTPPSSNLGNRSPVETESINTALNLSPGLHPAVAAESVNGSRGADGSGGPMTVADSGMSGEEADAESAYEPRSPSPLRDTPAAPSLPAVDNNGTARAPTLMQAEPSTGGAAHKKRKPRKKRG